jgi:peptidoglycan/LPS O-acetylase OafA/YrhL
MRSLGLRRILANRWVAVIGGMCYSIYLLHLILISAVSKVTRVLVLPAAPYSVNYAIQLLITGIPVVLLCVIFYVMIERPCMNPNWPTALWQMLTARRGNTKRSLAS